MVFPYDFGFVSSTKAGDGDPLDLLALTDDSLFPGCLVECMLIGAIEAEQEEKGKNKRNDRLIAVAQQSLLYSEVRDIDDLNPTVLKQIKAFFVNYQKVRDVKFKITGAQRTGQNNGDPAPSCTAKICSLSSSMTNPLFLTQYYEVFLPSCRLTLS